MMMRLSVAIQMDPVENIDLQCDSTYLIALEAKKRDYKLYAYIPKERNGFSLTKVTENLAVMFGGEDENRKKFNDT